MDAVGQAVIRVESAEDPTVFAECKVTVDVETGVSAIEVGRIEVNGRRVTVPEGQKASVMTVYTPDGKLIVRREYVGEEMVLELPYSGIYLLNMEGGSVKIVTK